MWPDGELWICVEGAFLFSESIQARKYPLEVWGADGGCWMRWVSFLCACAFRLFVVVINLVVCHLCLEYHVYLNHLKLANGPDIPTCTPYPDFISLVSLTYTPP